MSRFLRPNEVKTRESTGNNPVIARVCQSQAVRNNLVGSAEAISRGGKYIFAGWRPDLHVPVSPEPMLLRAENNAEISFTGAAGRSPLAVLLDKIIVLLMVAILLTMSWPVSMVLWQQSRPARHSALPVPRSTGRSQW